MKSPERPDGVDREGRVRLTRRSLLAGLSVLGAGWVGLGYRSRGAELRPPGAAADGEFDRRCIRCLRCATVCPTKSIRFDSALSLAVSDTPKIDALSRGCCLCMKCTQVCPTGALTPTDPDPDAVLKAVRMGTVELDQAKCIPWVGNGECRACYHVCPYPGTAVRLEGMQLAPVFDPEVCVGCGLCAEACPDRARAIRIRPAGA
jgi:ferredoxin